MKLIDSLVWTLSYTEAAEEDPHTLIPPLHSAYCCIPLQPGLASVNQGKLSRYRYQRSCEKK